MKINSTSGNGNFKIINNNHELLELKYKNWFSSKAKTKLNNTEIEIKPKNLWNTSFDIYHNGIDVGDITFNWKTNAIITINDDKYLFKAIGLWNLKFELVNENEDRIFLIKPNYKWKKMKYDYEIEIISDTYKLYKLTELLIYVGFGANLHMTATMRN